MKRYEKKLEMSEQSEGRDKKERNLESSDAKAKDMSEDENRQKKVYQQLAWNVKGSKGSFRGWLCDDK